MTETTPKLKPNTPECAEAIANAMDTLAQLDNEILNDVTTTRYFMEKRNAFENNDIHGTADGTRSDRILNTLAERYRPVFHARFHVLKELSDSIDGATFSDADAGVGVYLARLHPDAKRQTALAEATLTEFWFNGGNAFLRYSDEQAYVDAKVDEFKRMKPKYIREVLTHEDTGTLRNDTPTPTDISPAYSFVKHAKDWDTDGKGAGQFHLAINPMENEVMLSPRGTTAFADVEKWTKETVIPMLHKQLGEDATIITRTDAETKTVTLEVPTSKMILEVMHLMAQAGFDTKYAPLSYGMDHKSLSFTEAEKQRAALREELTNGVSSASR